MAATVRLKTILLTLMCVIASCTTLEHPIKCSYRPPKPDEDETVNFVSHRNFRKWLQKRFKFFIQLKHGIAWFKVLHQIHIESAHVIKKRSIDQKLRIKLIYDASVHSLPPNKLSIVKNILPKAKLYWEETLRVRPMKAPILLSRKCEGNKMFYLPREEHPYCRVSCDKVTMCGEVEVPEKHLDICRSCNENGRSCQQTYVKGKGVEEADFVFYVSALQTERCQKGSTIAYAAHCQLEGALDRPIAGHANLCPDAINTKAQDQDTLFSTMKHEILHALGFSLSLFAYYRDENGIPRTPRGANGKPELNETLQNWQWSDQVIRTVTRDNWKVRGKVTQKTINLIVTPRVVKEVRLHFNCPTLEGAELEDQGGDGTELTHWEKRIFENEAMTGIHTQNPVYSRLTLALLEDTGWYTADYNKAENLTWGRSLGCDFATKSCLEWIEKQSKNKRNIYPFCNIVKRDPLYTSCSEDRTALTVCNLVEYEKDLPEEYQNFESLPDIPSHLVGRYGGSLVLSDYCPFFQEFHWKTQNISIRGSKCTYEENNIQPENNLALENYSNSSSCFKHVQVPWEEKHCSHSRHKQHYGSGCYQFLCSENRLKVQVHDRVYTCYKEDQILQIRIFFDGKLHSGQIVCPRCKDLCEGQCLPDSTRLPQPQYMIDELVCDASFQRINLITLLLILITFWL